MKSIGNCTKTRSKLLTAALLLTACLLFACSPSQLVIPTVSTETPIEKAAAISYDAELTLTMPLADTTVDPYGAISYKTQNLLNLVYETPIVLDQTGKHKPYLFESWEMQTDGSVLFSVRKNVRFHDGEFLTARHIADCLKEIRLAGSSSNYAYVMGAVQSWQVSQDGMQITIVPQKGVYPLLMALTFPVTNGKQQCGTGPYVLSVFHEGEGMMLERNDAWWMKAPRIKTIHVKPLQDDAAQIQSLAMGELDLVYTRADNLSSYKNSNKYKILSVRSNTFEFISLNLSSASFANADVKNAVLHAVDKKDIIANVYQSAAVLAEVPIPADSWMHSGTLPSADFDLAMAKGYIAACGFTDADGDGYLDSYDENGLAVPYTLRLVTDLETSTLIHRDASDRIAKQLKQIGIKVKVEAYPLSELKQVLQSGAYDMAYLGTSIAADASLADFYAAGGSLNFGGYSSAKMDGLLNQLTKTRDEQSFLSVYAQIQKLAFDDMPIIGICFKNDTVFYSEKLAGIGAVTVRNIYSNIDEWTITND